MKQKMLYVCPECLQVCAEARACHGHAMLPCYPGDWGDERRRPVTDQDGKLLSSAPRWFLEAAGWIQAGPRYTPLIH